MIPSSRLYVNSLHLSFLQQSNFRLSSFPQEEIGPKVMCDTSNAKMFHVVFRHYSKSCLFKSFNFLNTKAQPLRESYGRAGLGGSLGTNSTAASPVAAPGPGLMSPAHSLACESQATEPGR
jgi:hypothetical protein